MLVNRAQLAVEKGTRARAELAPFFDCSRCFVIDVARLDLIQRDQQPIGEAAGVVLDQIDVKAAAAVGTLRAVDGGDDRRGDLLDEGVKFGVVELCAPFQQQPQQVEFGALRFSTLADCRPNR